jgi:hypothetical protein
MEAFLVSTGIVALAEMGDKTQLLSLVLAARFRKPWPIVLGIFVATWSTMRWPAPSAPGSPPAGPRRAALDAGRLVHRDGRSGC